MNCKKIRSAAVLCLLFFFGVANPVLAFGETEAKAVTETPLPPLAYSEPLLFGRSWTPFKGDIKDFLAKIPLKDLVPAPKAFYPRALILDLVAQHGQEIRDKKIEPSPSALEAFGKKVAPYLVDPKDLNPQEIQSAFRQCGYKGYSLKQLPLPPEIKKYPVYQGIASRLGTLYFFHDPEKKIFGAVSLGKEVIYKEFAALQFSKDKEGYHYSADQALVDLGYFMKQGACLVSGRTQ